MTRLEELREKVLPVLLPWGVKRVAVFGSVSRGEETPESDIDILVELKEPGQRPVIGLKWFGLEQELSRVLGRAVDLVSAAGLSPYARESVQRDMVVIYDER
ncbi:MAG: nucleotidyltransferase family protein [Armatimonadetes bacterium]|nr:nucleotidyltransferase family protein [Armatimonadota bacterium]